VKTEGLAFHVLPDEAGERLDKVVAGHLAHLGRRAVADLFRRGGVSIARRAAKKGDRAREGQRVDVALEATEPIRGEPDAPLDVRLETTDVVVVRKPAGQPTVPLHPGESGTLAHALLGRYPELAEIGHRAREPGLIHRLDTQTSGLLVAARHAKAFEHLIAMLFAGRFDKRYLAIVEAAGLGSDGVVERALEPDPRASRKVVVLPAGTPDPRRTEWKTLREGPRFSLIEVRVGRAYRHQVRAHLAFAGHPIVGDALYGGTPVPSLGARHALHATYVAWAGDDRVPAFAVTDELPADLALLVPA
jgi:23S rRNA pseudouridine1911/1915/1917 synthase